MLILTSCQQTGVSAGEADPLVATSAPTQSVPAAPLVAAPPKNRVGFPWSLIGMSADGTRLYLSYGVGDGCGDYTGEVYVQETEGFVAIASLPVATTPTEREGDACATVLKTQDGYVQLAEPLGERPLIHLPLS